MPLYLLTGAGFSRNWGGLLAAEVFEYLLGSPQVDAELREVLWACQEHGVGLEDALGRLQAACETENNPQDAQTLTNLLAALQVMFAEMNDGFGRREFDPGTAMVGMPREQLISGFLDEFDAIFTLNQDTLLEQKYSSNQSVGFYRPGIPLTRSALSAIGPGQATSLFRPAEPFELRPDAQAYFKPHGSSDFLNERELMLIMGANKENTIRRHPLLNWYLDEFRRRLMDGWVSLMVIGYSFADMHINSAIVDAARAGKLRLFIMDTAGVDVLKKPEAGHRDLRYLQRDLKESIVGASRRPLLSIFGNNDPVEFMKISRFLNTSAVWGRDQ